MKLTSGIKTQLRKALQEDLGLKGDLTSRLLVPASARSRAQIIARQAGVFCGREAVRFLFQTLDSRLQIRFRVRDGGCFKTRSVLIEINGRTQAILAAERTVLNLMGRLCGIAALTQAFVQKARPYGVQVLDTRKTTPLWRELEKYAVLCGGGKNHRMGLYDAIFVKENHRAYGQFHRLKRYPRQFEIEVRNRRELIQALALKPKVILLDNFTPAALKRAVAVARKADPRVILEASGGIHLNNIASFARTGVDWISSGALTHSVPSCDLSLLISSPHHPC